ncbi:glucan biosynthesis protein G [Alteromonas sp. 14N.309.X.WAT.G.H12]|uniref:glucan biosynthesis protein n=1 Tax=Alteromonas sp. 14N.309.X.WAT.G.H12 TaxID=3120824 RepID=UPI002FCFEDF6
MLPRNLLATNTELLFSMGGASSGIFSVRPAVLRAFIFCLCFAFSALSLADEIAEENLPAGKPILNRIIEEARISAEQDYVVNDHNLAQELKDIDYQTYRQIRFNPDKALWKNKHDYEVQFFHPGFLYQQPVSVVTIAPDNSENLLTFNSDKFIYEKNAQPLAKLTDENSGYAGFRIHYPIKNKNYKDEFAVFLGASYFRLVGKNQVYGISARGLAVNTAMPEGEEFPHFTQFWLIEPRAGQPIKIYARLESPSVSGTYSFELMPGKDTTMEVKSWIFARQDVDKLGVAPFTSMFLYGENSQQRHDDYRPEVHDSDGVLMLNHVGEVIWRPLTNPRRLQVTSLSDIKPQGFGMLQRDTDFANYLDAEANYHLRPSLWVTPKVGFDKGKLEIVEIPTDSEVHDNIVAYWVPDTPFLAGESRYFAYTLKTVEKQPMRYGLATVVRTRQGASRLPGFETTEERHIRRFVVDFELPDGMTVNPDKVNLILDATNAQVEQAKVFAVDGGNSVRVTFLVIPKSDAAVDMRMFLNQDETQMSEIWSYVYEPQ